MLNNFIHYATIVSVVGINSIGVGIGQGLTYAAAIKAMNQQPSARNEISYIAFLGSALIETTAILSVSMSIMIIISSPEIINNYYGALAEFGIALALCLSGLTIGIVTSYPAQAACHAIARQPFFDNKISLVMFITQSIIQTPLIFSFIIAMFIKNQCMYVTSLPEALRLLGAGLCIGIGSVGPTYGLAYFARTACNSIGRNRNAYNQILKFTLISEAIIETPILFSLLISLLLLFSAQTDDSLIRGVAFISAALCTALGTLAPGISSAKTASAACHHLALQPELHAQLSRTSLFAQILIDTSAMYPLLISFVLILFT